MRPKPKVRDVDQVDWSAIRLGMLQRIRALLYRRDEALADDLAQEATIRLLRTLRREPAHELEKLMTTVASRTFADHLRRRHESPMAPDDPRMAELSTPAEQSPWRHPLDLLDIVMRELLRQQDPMCLYLYRQWRQKREWKQVAAQMNPPSTAAAVRQKYSRCLKSVLPRLRADERYRRIAEYAGVEEG